MGVFGGSLDAARASEFFAWFHLQPVDEPAGAHVVRFRPEGPLGDRTALDVETTEATITRVTLRLDRAFVDDARDGAFAADAATSFVRAACPPAAFAPLADALQARMMQRPGMIVAAGATQRDRAPAAFAEILRAYDGGTEGASITLDGVRFAIRTTEEPRNVVELTVTPA